MSSPVPTARLEARLLIDVHATLKRAAQLQGRTLTDFVVGAAHEAALRAIEEIEVIRISAEGQKLGLRRRFSIRRSPMRPCAEPTSIIVGSWGMSEFPYRIEPLTSQHDRSSFSCGSPPLDRYIREQATQDIRRRVAKCFVALATDDARVA